MKLLGIRRVDEEEIRRADVTLSRPMRNIRARYPLFLSQTLTWQTSGNDIWDLRLWLGLMVEVACGCDSVEGHACVLLNTFEESRQTKRIAWTSMRGHSCTSCAGQPKRYRKTTRTWNPSLGPATGGRSNKTTRGTRRAVTRWPGYRHGRSWANGPSGRSRRNRVLNRSRRAINFVEGMWSEYWTAVSGRNPLRKNCGKSSVHKGSSGEPPWQEQGENWEGRNRTDRSRGHPHDEESRGAQLINSQCHFGHVRMTAKHHFINCPREMFPCTKKQNVFNGTIATHVHQLRPQRFVSTSPEKDVCTQELRSEMKTLVCGIPAGNPLSVQAKARFGHSVSTLSRQCSRLGENRCSNSASDRGERIPSDCVVNGMVSESQRCGRVVCLSTSTTSRSWRSFVLWVAFTWLIWPCERCLDRDC